MSCGLVMTSHLSIQSIKLLKGKFLKINYNTIVKILGYSLLCYLLCACSDGEKQTGTVAESDWFKDEILLQLAGLRKDVNSLKDEVAKLDDKITNKTVNNRVLTAPEQVWLGAGMVLGDAHAKIAIVEFADFQCPFCVRHYKAVMPKIKKELINTGKVKYVMYDFPLSFHGQARLAAVAARCAGKQDKFWEMHDVLFDNQSGLTNTLFLQTARTLKLNEATFANCLEDSGVSAAVESNIEYGNQLGVTGTPKFFVGKVNGDSLHQVVVISGAQDFNAFKSAIEKL